MVLAALFPLLLVCGCHRSFDANAKGVELDGRLADIYLHKDALALAVIVAPDYYCSGDGFEWNREDLLREFPKINLSEFHIERRKVKQLSPRLLLINDIVSIRETYSGRDISGRYANSDIWVRRGGQWFLLVEQEIRLR